MITDIEFFSEEPLENVITCLRSKVDRVFFVGEKEKMLDKRDNLEDILKNKASVSYVDYIFVDKKNIDSMCKKIGKVISDEQERGNYCFLEITGGEDVCLMVAGILRERYRLDVRYTDIRKKSSEPKHQIKLNVEEFIHLQGGCINEAEQKNYKKKLYSGDDDFIRMVKTMWRLCSHHNSEWNDFCNKFSLCNNYLENLTVCVPKGKAVEDDRTRNINNGIAMKLSGIINELKLRGYLHNVYQDKERLEFTYKNSEVKDLLNDAGCVLELYTCLMAIESGFFDSCMIGVPIDWDGVLHQGNIDVENEIDVFLMKDNVPIFISCKNGRYSKEALYELDTVAKNIGGSYAKKVIVATQVSKDGAFEERAREMDIKIIGREIIRSTKGEVIKMLKNILK